MSTAPANAAKEPASLERLCREVLDPGLCVACGACVGLCPHIIFQDGRVAAPDACGLAGGRCHDLCPQAVAPDTFQRRRALLAARGETNSEGIGPVRQIWEGRATAADLAGRVQYGGVVSELMSLALETGMVGEAVLTAADGRGSPRGVRVADREGVVGCGGSVYAAGASLAVVNQALAEPHSDHPLGLVGLPCQALAAAAMAAHPNYPAAGRLGLVIGLFCTMNLSARGLRRLLAEAGIGGPVTRGDFPPPPAGIFQVWTEDGYREIPLEEVYRTRLSGCALCPDLTAELADVSVGSREGKDGLNTIIVRSERGEELVAEAIRRGSLELGPIDDEALSHLKTAAANKAERARAAVKERVS